MKKDTLCCDFCEEIFDNGGFRIFSKNKSNEPLDICGDCLAEVVSDYSQVTGKTVLVVETSDADYMVLSGGDDLDENNGEVPQDTGFAAV